jgi:hypothetical protein
VQQTGQSKLCQTQRTFSTAALCRTHASPATNDKINGMCKKQRSGLNDAPSQVRERSVSPYHPVAPASAVPQLPVQSRAKLGAQISTSMMQTDDLVAVSKDGMQAGTQWTNH